MIRLVPDWLLYIVMITVVVFVLFRVDRRQDAPEAYRNESPVAGSFLPPPSEYDPAVLVEVGPIASGMGSAFAISQDGWWLTARHVVDGCTRVGLAVGGGRMVRVEQVRTSHDTDLALLVTDRAPTALQLGLDRELRVGETAFHVGFPQGESGEAVSVLEARSNLITRGRYEMEEPVLTWSERGRSEGIEGTLSGMSGGPVFDVDGSVIGVTVAESPRRGRIYSASPDSIRKFLDSQGEVPYGGDARPISASSYEAEADRMRDERAVVKVLCRVGDR